LIAKEKKDMSKLALMGGAAAIAMSAGLASANIAKTFSFGSFGALPDNIPGGVTRDVIVPDDGTQLKDVAISVTWGTATVAGNRKHTWAGDIRMVLTHVETNRSVVIMDRVGQVVGTPTGVGDSSDLAGTYNFVSSGGASFAAAATAAGATVNIPTGNYAPFSINSGLSANLLDFLQGPKAGTWRVTISDNAGGDTGEVLGVTLTLFNVPAPGAAAVLGLAGLAGLRRRR